MEYQEIAASKLAVAAQRLCRDGSYHLTAMFACDERSLTNNFAIYCIFAGKGEFKALKGLLPAGGRLEYPSLTPELQLAAWYEREIHDLFGLVPVGHPDLRRMVLHENWPAGHYPMRRDFSAGGDISQGNVSFPMTGVQGEGIFEVPVGPIHAGIIEPGHFRFSQSGEQIVHLDAKLFFTHRGIEKGLEGMPLDMAIYQIERICGACSVSHALSFSQAAEALGQVEISPRALAIRGVTAELERLYNHVGDIGNLCAGLGFAVGISHGSRLKEMLMRLNERLTGNRFLRGMVVPGGVKYSITAELLQDIQEVLLKLETEFAQLMEILQENTAFLDRVNTTGIVPFEAAKELGIVGVAARASGVDSDWRRDYPYGVYREWQFAVPVYDSGDVAARLWVRAEETVQSIAFIRQLLPQAAGSGRLAAPLPLLPAYSSALGWSESARGSNLHWLMVGEHNKIYRYAVRSASYPNWPAVALAAPGNIIPDFPLINKSFELCYACLDR